MSAKEMFEKLGYQLFSKDEEILIYKCRTDYVDNSVIFHLGYCFPETYDVSFIEWWDSKTLDWIPMNNREKNLKHCAKYGHWQKVDRGITIGLHKAINKQVEELGWEISNI